MPVEIDSPGFDDDSGDDVYPDEGGIDEEPPSYDEAPPPSIGKTVTDIGKNYYRDFEPMGKAMLKYLGCQAGLGNINALNQFLLAKRVDDAKDILAAKACYNEFSKLVLSHF